MALNLLNFHTLCMDLSFPLKLERQASSLAASLFLPVPNSGNLSFRIARFPSEGTEVITDIYKHGSRFHVQVTRFLVSLRDRIANGHTGKHTGLDVATEISCSTCERDNPLVAELRNRPPFDLRNDLSGSESENHYFIFFTDSKNCVAKAVSQPYAKPWTEDWQRLINRSYGAEHLPPRRNKALI